VADDLLCVSALCCRKRVLKNCFLKSFCLHEVAVGQNGSAVSLPLQQCRCLRRMRGCAEAAGEADKSCTVVYIPISATTAIRYVH
jgi:hypothetical protein